MVRNRPSLAGQLLILQVVVVLLVLLAVTVLIVTQTQASFRRDESRQVLSTAETAASTQVIVKGLASGSDAGVAGAAERARSLSGASYVIVTDVRGRVLYSPRPTDRDERLTRPGTGQWVGEAPGNAPAAVEARVPVIAASPAPGVQVGQTIGFVLVGREYPPLMQVLAVAAPSLITYVGVASLVGIGGSLLLSRRIKRQTLGLEPAEIAGLVEHREAMLHGLREGVVGVDVSGHVTLLNDEATRLLGLDREVVGEPVTQVGIPEPIRSVLTGDEPADDVALLAEGRALVVNQMPVHVRGQRVGFVTTLRDRTELVGLSHQVDVWRGTTEALRAQAHEFSNRMHTVAGLLELEEYAEAAQFLAADSRARAGWTDRVTDHIHDAPVAALLVAKGSRAAERRVTLDLTADSRLSSLDDELSADVLTVLGNLVDNAMDAVTPGSGDVEIDLRGDATEVLLTVRDNGPGVPVTVVDKVFQKGYSTKESSSPQARGWGLALSRLVCRRRGGDLVLAGGARTTFSARLPQLSDSRPREMAHE